MTTDGSTRRRAPSRGDISDAVKAVARSTKSVMRQARARYTTDVISWPYRDELGSVWATVDRIPGWFNEGTAAVLYGIMRGERPTTVVEIGSYLGRSTVFFGLALQRLGIPGRVVAIDPHTGDRQQLEGLSVDRLPSFDLFREHCRAAGVEDAVEAQVTSSLEAAARWSGPIDLLFIDGWHSYDAVVADGEAWLPSLSRHGVAVFDDYAAYDEVRDAVDDLAGRGLFTLWGDVFGQALGGARADPPRAAHRALLLSGNRFKTSRRTTAARQPAAPRAR